MRTSCRVVIGAFVLALVFLNEAMGQQGPASSTIPALYRFLFETDASTPNAAEQSWLNGLSETTRHGSTRALVNVPDSSLVWSWDTLTAAWATHAYARGYYTLFDSHFNVLQHISQSWNGTSWQNAVLMDYTFDAQDNCTSMLRKTWNGSTWINAQQVTYTYDINNHELSFLEQGWNGSAWENMQQTMSSYDASGNLTEQITQFWIGTWENFSRDSSTYDINNNLLDQTHFVWNAGWENNAYYAWTYNGSNQETTSLRQSWNGSAWENAVLYSNHYGINNLADSTFFQVWMAGAWTDYSLTTYFYNAQDQMVMQLGQKYVASILVNATRGFFTYDANGNRDSDLEEVWNGSGWISYSYNTTGFDANNFFVWDQYRYYDNTGLVVTDGDSIHIYAHVVIVGINDAGTEQKQLTVYPNPVPGTSFMVSYPPSANPVELQIINSLGQQVVVEQFVRQGSGTVDVSQFAPGIYTLFVVADGQRFSTLFMVTKE